MPLRAQFLGVLLLLMGTLLLPSQVPAQEPLPMPTPPEYFLALSKKVKPRWRTLYTPVPELTTADRHRSALHLGMLVSDAYVAAEARDSQRVRNLTQDLRAALVSLGLHDNGEERLQRIAAHADLEDWNAVRFELEASGRELATHFAILRDNDLIILAEVGLWLRSLETGSRIIKEIGDPAKHGTFCVGSPELLSILRSRLTLASERTQKLDFIAELDLELSRLQKRWDKEDHVPTTEDVDATLLKITNYLKRTFKPA